MSGSSDYVDGMLTPLSISDAEVEALFDGADGLRADLSDVAAVVATIQAIGRYDADRDFSHLIAAAALESRATPVARYATAQAASASWEWTTRVVPRVAVGAAALLMLVISSSGLAFAANGAKPGDMLYGLDRAAEVIGIGDGGADERYAEAQALVAAGKMPGGLALAAEILDRTPGGEEAKPAVADAAARLQAEPSEAPSDVALTVGDLLIYIHGAAITGVIDTNTVSSLAQKIGGPPGEAPGNSGNTPGHDDEEPGNSVNAPGQDQETADASEDGPGQSEDAPGQGGEAPGNSENAPGQSQDEEGDVEDEPGRSEDAPGQTGDTPGQSGDTQGSSGDTSGQSEGNPGQGPPTEPPGPPIEPPAPPVTTPAQSTPGSR